MAPTIGARAPSPEYIRQVSKSLSSLSIRDVASSASSLCSVFAVVMASNTSLSKRALISLSDLHTEHTYAGSAQHLSTLPLAKRQNAILAIPTTYAGLNNGPAPGAVVGIMLGTILGFLLVLYVVLLSVQFFGVGVGNTVIEEEIIVKRSSKSKSRSRSKKSVRSEHVSEHISEHISVAASPPPPRSRRETILEVHETITRHRSPSPESVHDPEEVIVMEEESSHMSEDIVEVIEEQSSIVSPEPAPPSRKPSQNRRSGFRTVDPAEFGGGERPMRRLSRRS